MRQIFRQFAKNMYQKDVLRLQRKEIRRRDRKNFRHSHRKGDRRLTREQVKQIKGFWKKYKFLYKVYPKTMGIYLNRSGDFDVRYLPIGFERELLRLKYIDEEYDVAFRHKNYVSRILSNLKQPPTVIRKIEGLYFDGEYNHLTLDQAAEECFAFLSQEGNDDILLKPTFDSGGEGITFIKKGSSKQTIQKLLETGEPDIIIQKVVKQHPQLSAIYPHALSTVRVVSFLFRGEVHILSAFLRLGVGGNRVDNVSRGGVGIGINPDGTLKKVGYDKKRNQWDRHPDGFVFEGFRVPSYDKIIEEAKKSQYMFPMLRLIFWDFSVDEQGDPLFIECNMRGSPFPQFSHGPLFGDMTEAVLDDVLERYYYERSSFNFDYQEFHDHIVITKFCGTGICARVPKKIRGKPVTVIGKKTFAYCRVLIKVTLPETLERIEDFAFFGCSLLMKIVIPSQIKHLGRSTFNCCRSLRKVVLPEGLEKISKYAFAQCQSLKNLKIPKKVTVIEKTALPENVRLHCHKGSAAEEYGKTENLPIVYLDEK